MEESSGVAHSLPTSSQRPWWLQVLGHPLAESQEATCERREPRHPLAQDPSWSCSFVLHSYMMFLSQA